MPVLFYIHSGAYVFGNPRVWPFDHWVHQSPTVVIVAGFSALQLLCLGIMGEYVGRIYATLQRRPTYYVAHDSLSDTSSAGASATAGAEAREQRPAGG